MRLARAEADWTRVEAPHLRIIDEELWCAAQAKHPAKTREPTSEAARGRKPKYLLSGLARCDICGGPMQANNRKASYETIKAYVCAWHRDRGTTACENGLGRPVASVDEAVLEWIGENVLREELVLETLRELRRCLGERLQSTDDQLPKIDAQCTQVRREIARLVDALAKAEGTLHSLAPAIAEREERLAALEAQLRAARAAPSALNLEVRRLEREARARLGRFRELMSRTPEQARQAIEALATAPLKMTPVETPEGKRYRLEGVFDVGAMFLTEGAGESGFRTKSVPSGRATRFNQRLRGPGADRGSAHRRLLVQRGRPRPVRQIATAEGLPCPAHLRRLLPVGSLLHDARNMVISGCKRGFCT